MIRRGQKLSTQVQSKITRKEEKKKDYDFGTVISTGSTLLDLAISGTRVRGGGLPGGILVEIFGPSGCGKTVLLSEIAGNIQQSGGQVMFHDPESRLNKQFASLFGLKINKENYTQPDTIPEVFKGVRDWKPEIKKDIIHGVMTDSLAALSTNLEMEKDEGDKMGMRRAKEFSEELRKTCRIITKYNYLMVCSNQVRVNTDAGPYVQKYIAPGGEAIGFYSSLRLRCHSPRKLDIETSFAGKKINRIAGIETKVEVIKSSIDKPYRTAPLTIWFDYGIDDIRANLQFLKTYTKSSVYCLGDQKLGQSMEEAIKVVEDAGVENEVKEAVIDLWERIESKFESKRKSKRS